MMVAVSQTYAGLSPAWRELEKILLEHRYRHGGHPVLRWMAGNVETETDGAGNQKPSKARSKERIDGMVSLTMAESRWMTYSGVESRADGGPAMRYARQTAIGLAILIGTSIIVAAELSIEVPPAMTTLYQRVADRFPDGPISDRRPLRSAFDTVDFNGVTTYPLMMPQQTLGFKQEEIAPTYGSLVRSAYKTNPVVFACMERAAQRLQPGAGSQWQQVRGGTPRQVLRDCRPHHPREAMGRTRRPPTSSRASSAMPTWPVTASPCGAVRCTRCVPIGSPSSRRPRGIPTRGLAAIDAEVIGYAYWPGGKGVRR